MLHKHITLFLLLCTASIQVKAQDDGDGCKDHPMFSRMNGFYIEECKNEYAEERFVDAGYKLIGGTTTYIPVEGNMTRIVYRLKEGAKKPSTLQIRRNYGNAIKGIGGSVVLETTEWDFGNADLLTMKQTKGGKTIWSSVYINHLADGEAYVLTVVEPDQMQQDVAATDLLKELNAKGFVNFQINFDNNKSVLKEDGYAVVDQIASLLEADPSLKLSIEGHTDNVGNASANLALSEARASAVSKALVQKNAAYASRLSTKGWGQTKPIADNATEEGRAQNRRVSVVKK
jgi:outer membrane protein OmpA-like peptidoglycan-associated protein